MTSLFLFALGCADPSSSTPETGAIPYCEEVSQSVSRDDATGIGIPASDFLDAMPLAEDLVLSWAEGTTDTLSWSFSPDETTLALITSEVVTPETDGPVATIAVECFDYISVAGTLNLESADGRLQESLDVTVQLYGSDATSEGPLAVLSTTIAVTDLDGTLALEDYVDPAVTDSVDLSLGGELYFGSDMADFVGSLRARSEQTDGSTVTLESFDIAQWGPAASEE
jgi:hypothetical protein